MRKKSVSTEDNPAYYGVNIHRKKCDEVYETPPTSREAAQEVVYEKVF